MAKLPVVSGAEAVRAFQRAGWRVEPGTLRALVRAAGMSIDDFAARL
jgi:hypothetical protein